MALYGKVCRYGDTNISCSNNCYFHFKKTFLICCGGRTRTCDLLVMSQSSYHLLYSAIRRESHPHAVSCLFGSFLYG